MEKIKLSSREKKVFRMVANGIKECPEHFPIHKFIPALRVLESHKLIKVTWVSDDIPWVIAMTKYGRAYLAENPTLSNPINWEAVGIGISILIAIFSALLSCAAYANTLS